VDGNQKKRSITIHMVEKNKKRKRKRFELDIGLQIVRGLLLNQKVKGKKAQFQIVCF